MDGPRDLAGDLEARLAQLEYENAKLKKINKVLIDRVERSMDFQGNAFSLFQTAIVLEGRVRDRTSELEQALRELGKSNRALSVAKEMAETAEMRLMAAIESTSEGFVLFDSEDRLVMCNSKYREFWPGLHETIRPGVPFRELAERAQALGLFDDHEEGMSPPLQRRLVNHNHPEELFILRLADGRWLQIRERSTADGGSVAIYADITAIKLAERRQRERELAAKSVILEATFDNISQGILVVDAERRLLAWNERFLKLLNISEDELIEGKPLQHLGHLPAIRPYLLHGGKGALPSDSSPFCIEQQGDDGRVLEIQLNALPDGGMVATYTDITERKAAEWALRDSEQRIRLITDALPALIAYVDAGQRYRFTNKPYEEWFGRPRSEINGRHMRKVLGEELYEARRPYVEEVLSGRLVTFEITYSHPVAGIEYAMATYVPHHGPDGEVLGFIALIQDITERKKSAVQLREAKENLERRVAERTIELTTVNTKLQQEVEERRQAEEALRIAKAEAEAANMSKTKFIAAASHDLLQPLNAARIFTQALSETRIAGKNRGYVENVGRALESVEELITALLDISKLDSGAQLPQLADFMLDDMMAGLIKETAPQAEARGLQLKWVKCHAALHSDPLMVRRILRNFLSNAMRYTPRGRILMGCRRLPQGVAVQVWDSGIGIPEDKLSEVFQEFRRLAQDSHGRDSGLGLGLAIVDRIARRMGVEIQVRSKLGQGSMFGVVLPYGDQRRASDRQAARAHLSLPAGTDKLDGARILVIENDNAERVGMQALLEGWRCRVSAAADACHLHYPDEAVRAVVADYHLDEGRTGIQALQDIRSRLGSEVPAVILTADRSDEVLAEAKALGAHLLNKPLKPARLRSLLAHLVG